MTLHINWTGGAYLRTPRSPRIPGGLIVSQFACAAGGRKEVRAHCLQARSSLCRAFFLGFSDVFVASVLTGGFKAVHSLR